MAIRPVTINLLENDVFMVLHPEEYTALLDFVAAMDVKPPVWIQIELKLRLAIRAGQEAREDPPTKSP